MRIWEKIINKRGAFLIESMIGIIIISITLACFSMIVMQAANLSRRSRITSKEWEKIFGKMEKGDFSAVYEEGNNFNVVLYLEDVKKSEIILSNGNSLGSDTQYLAMDSIQGMSITNLAFFRYEETVNSLAANHGNIAYVYDIKKM